MQVSSEMSLVNNGNGRLRRGQIRPPVLREQAVGAAFLSGIKPSGCYGRTDCMCPDGFYFLCTYMEDNWGQGQPNNCPNDYMGICTPCPEAPHPPPPSPSTWRWW